jgi:hypothetical protein
MTPAELQAHLESLRRAYLELLPVELDGFRAAIESGDDPAARERARAIAHKLAGTGGLYGAPELSAWGREAERAARRGGVDELRAVADGLERIISRLR